MSALVLGGVFIAAAIPKIIDPPAFAHEIYNYRLLPGPAVNAAALLLPWIEALCGIALVVGLWKPEATILVAALLVLFLGAVSINLARGHAVDCGCFDVRASGRSREELLRDMRWVLLRDAGLLVLAVPILAGSRRRDGKREAKGEPLL